MLSFSFFMRIQPDGKQIKEERLQRKKKAMF